MQPKVNVEKMKADMKKNEEHLKEVSTTDMHDAVDESETAVMTKGNKLKALSTCIENSNRSKLGKPIPQIPDVITDEKVEKAYKLLEKNKKRLSSGKVVTVEKSEFNKIVPARKTLDYDKDKVDVALTKEGFVKLPENPNEKVLFI